MFKLVKNCGARTEAPDVISIKVEDATYAEGVALAVDTSQHLFVKASGSKQAEFITAEAKTLSADGYILAYRVLPGMVFETSAAGAVNEGSHYQFASTADGITTSACVEVSSTVASTTGTGAVTYGALVLDTLSAAGTTRVILK